jgi:uncharacterized protein YqgC (DUF456 family)
MDWPSVMGVALVVLGCCSALAGIVFGLLPVLPGPPVAMAGPVLVVAGFTVMGEPVSGWGWAMLVAVLLAGLLVTAIDLFAPLLGKKIGGTGRGAMVGAYFGLMIALLFSLHIGGLGAATSLLSAGLTLLLGTLGALALLFLGPMLGGMVGDLVAKPVQQPRDPASGATKPTSQLLWESLGAGVAQCLGLLITTGTKVLYGIGATAACALYVAGWLW